MTRLLKLVLLIAVFVSLTSASAIADDSTKKCEKCYRDANGKMVCEPVPCK